MIRQTQAPRDECIPRRAVPTMESETRHVSYKRQHGSRRGTFDSQACLGTRTYPKREAPSTKQETRDTTTRTTRQRQQLNDKTRQRPNNKDDNGDNEESKYHTTHISMTHSRVPPSVRPVLRFTRHQTPVPCH